MVLKQFQAIIYIVGDSPDKDPLYREQLETQASTLGIDSNVCFTGYCSNVAAVMEQCDILVHASTEPEPFGRVVLEAMSLGKAVVATRGGGPSEVITHGVDGILVTPGSPRSMAQEILKLISQDRYRQMLGGAGKQKVSTQYTAQAHVDLVVKAYFGLPIQP